MSKNNGVLKRLIKALVKKACWNSRERNRNVTTSAVDESIIIQLLRGHLSLALAITSWTCTGSKFIPVKKAHRARSCTRQSTYSYLVSQWLRSNQKLTSATPICTTLSFRFYLSPTSSQTPTSSHFTVLDRTEMEEQLSMNGRTWWQRQNCDAIRVIHPQRSVLKLARWTRAVGLSDCAASAPSGHRITATKRRLRGSDLARRGVRPARQRSVPLLSTLNDVGYLNKRMRIKRW